MVVCESPYRDCFAQILEKILRLLRWLSELSWYCRIFCLRASHGKRINDSGKESVNLISKNDFLLDGFKSITAMGKS
mgnify:CR=1 FL=1